MGGCSYTSGNGALAVSVEVRSIGQDRLVRVTGGMAHVGAVALAVPCPAEENGVRASASVMTVSGHRDDVIAHKTALKLCKDWQCTVCVIAGLHINDASADDIAVFMRNADAAVEAISLRIKETMYGSERLS